MKLNLKKSMSNVQPALEVTGGALLSSILTKHIPIGDPKMKQGAIFLAGVLLMSSGKAKGTISNLATGMIAGAGLNLVKEFMPNLAGVGYTGDPMVDVISGYQAEEVISGYQANDDIYNPEDEMPS